MIEEMVVNGESEVKGTRHNIHGWMPLPYIWNDGRMNQLSRGIRYQRYPSTVNVSFSRGNQQLDLLMCMVWSSSMLLVCMVVCGGWGLDVDGIEKSAKPCFADVSAPNA